MRHLFTSDETMLACHLNIKLLVMNNIPFFVAALALVFLVSCGTTPDDQNPEYNENLASMKAMFDGFQNKSIDPALFAEDFVDVGTGFEEEDRNKQEAMQQWKMMTRVMDAELVNAIYLPGIDTLSQRLDGSVRYYGQWKMTMGEAAQTLKAYGSMEFNDSGKITSFAHYADWTATFGALLAENPEIAAKLEQRSARANQ